ncbi:hypothetical protein C4D60_Mb09t15210 [Musa balbisiana]|uniref:Uncharacterized protein n=1 Tax=Musa balbisiana TaxID=52838 RepID=A0A4S8IJ29_MUSBA|nr:hypothetical protein C4D60_Mb09t15210 [Musa balbisiana]
MLLSSPTTLRPPPRPAARPRRSQPPLAIRLSLDSQDGGPALVSSGSSPVLVAQSGSPSLPIILGHSREPELGLFSILFVISMVVGSFFSLAMISLPALNAFKKLAVSADKLSKVVSEEVPGTLSSLKLSGLEINDLTFQLTILKQRISGKQHGTKQPKRRSSRVRRGNTGIN